MSDGGGEAAPPPPRGGGRVIKEPVAEKTLADDRARALRPENERRSQPGRRVKVLLTGWCRRGPGSHRLVTLELVSRESDLSALLRLQTRRREAKSTRHSMQVLAEFDGSLVDARDLKEVRAECECGVDTVLVVADLLDHLKRGDKQLFIAEGDGWVAKARRNP